MIHYHGLPITPNSSAYAAVKCRHAFISHANPGQFAIAAETCQSFAVDNGAYSAWTSGTPITDWSEYYSFIDKVSRLPNFDFCVIPDEVDGDENAQNALVANFTNYFHTRSLIGSPVWHMHENLDRLEYLCHAWPRVCIGSSKEYATVGNQKWWARIARAMEVACDEDGYPKAKLHGLRMLDPEIFSKLPLSSADSTNIGRNVGIDQAWKGSYTPLSKDIRAQIIRDRIEIHSAAPKWEKQFIQGELEHGD